MLARRTWSLYRNTHSLDFDPLGDSVEQILENMVENSVNFLNNLRDDGSGNVIEGLRGFTRVLSRIFSSYLPERLSQRTLEITGIVERVKRVLQ